MSTISKVHTACKDCAFSVYEGITQTGCALDYISKYKEKGTEVLEVYDNDKEFYVLNDKKCLGYRENKWFTQYNLEHAPLEDKITKFNELNHIQYLLLIDLKNFNVDTLEQLKKGINDCIIKPEKIIFVRYQSSKLFPYDILKQFCDDAGIKGKWRIQTMVDDDMSNMDILHNTINLNKGYRFILSINNPTIDINSLIIEADTIVYKNLDSMLAIKNTDKSAILFSAPSYRWSIVVERKNILEDENNYITI